MREILPVIVFNAVYIVVVPGTVDFQVLQEDLEVTETITSWRIYHVSKEDGACLEFMQTDNKYIKQLVKLLKVLKAIGLLTNKSTIELPLEDGIITWTARLL